MGNFYFEELSASIFRVTEFGLDGWMNGWLDGWIGEWVGG